MKKLKLDIYSTDKYNSNAYIIYEDTLFTTPILKSGNIDDLQWSLVEDKKEINNILDSNEITIIKTITVSEFLGK